MENLRAIPITALEIHDRPALTSNYNIVAQLEGPQFLRQIIALSRTRSNRRTLHTGTGNCQNGGPQTVRDFTMALEWRLINSWLLPIYQVDLCFLFSLHHTEYRQLSYY